MLFIPNIYIGLITFVPVAGKSGTENTYNKTHTIKINEE